ncbi:MAG: phosphodiester glycosidase family protein [Flammeovirgaceae bacterium]
MIQPQQTFDFKLGIIVCCMLFWGCQSAAPSENEQRTSINPSKQATHRIDSAKLDQDTSWTYITEADTFPAPQLPTFQKNTTAKPLQWEKLEQGLDVATVDAPITCSIGDSKIRIVRVNPSQFDFKLLAIHELQEEQMRTAEQYCEDFQLLGAINTSMFAYNMRSVGYMKNYTHLNNGKLNADKCIIAFNPKNQTVPAFKIIDLGCEDWEQWKDQYHSYIQNIRMIDCNQRVKWSKQEKFWSTACMGEDGKGNALFIHCRSPYRVHDFAKMLLQLPIDLKRCCYLEGGPESTLYVKTGAMELRSYGSYETGFNEDDDNNAMWQIPNIIGFTRKKR